MLNQTLKSMSHTKGDWVAIKNIGTPSTHRIESSMCVTIADVYEKADNSHAANAKLIAAAPDLLDALNGVLANTALNKIDNASFDCAVKAIEKATGNSIIK